MLLVAPLRYGRPGIAADDAPDAFTCLHGRPYGRGVSFARKVDTRASRTDGGGGDESGHDEQERCSELHDVGRSKRCEQTVRIAGERGKSFYRLELASVAKTWSWGIMLCFDIRKTWRLRVSLAIPMLSSLRAAGPPTRRKGQIDEVCHRCLRGPRRWDAHSFSCVLVPRHNYLRYRTCDGVPEESEVRPTGADSSADKVAPAPRWSTP
jgi:hypothetical protein